MEYKQNNLPNPKGNSGADPRILLPRVFFGSWCTWATWTLSLPVCQIYRRSPSPCREADARPRTPVYTHTLCVKSFPMSSMPFCWSVRSRLVRPWMRRLKFSWWHCWRCTRAFLKDDLTFPRGTWAALCKNLRVRSEADNNGHNLNYQRAPLPFPTPCWRHWRKIQCRHLTCSLLFCFVASLLCQIHLSLFFHFELFHLLPKLSNLLP